MSIVLYAARRGNDLRSSRKCEKLKTIIQMSQRTEQTANEATGASTVAHDCAVAYQQRDKQLNKQEIDQRSRLAEISTIVVAA